MFWATSQYLNGAKWCSWCVVGVKVEQRKRIQYHPCCLLGFDDIVLQVNAVVESSVTEMCYEKLQREFIVNF